MPPPPQQTGPSTARLLHAINHNGMLTDARLDAIERSGNYTRALHNSLEVRFRDLVTALQTTNARVDALEIQLFNRTFPNARDVRRTFPTLANRVAALERAAMTIPVGAVVNVVNPGGALESDDSETESTDHEE